MPDETVPADQADDTLESTAGDTLAADAGDDAAAEAAETVAAGAGDDTVAAGAGDDKSPFDEFGDPTAETTTTEPKPAQTTQAAAPGDDDEELTAIENEAKELDTTLGTDGRFSKAMKRLTDRDRKRESKMKELETSLDGARRETQWNRFQEQIGVNDLPPETQKALTKRDPKGATEIQKRFSKHFNAAIAAGANEDEARGEARATLKAEVKQLQQRANKPKPRSQPAIATSPSGARLSPPGGAAARPGKPKLSAEEAFDKGEWTLPN